MFKKNWISQRIPSKNWFLINLEEQENLNASVLNIYINFNLYRNRFLLSCLSENLFELCAKSDRFDFWD